MTGEGKARPCFPMTHEATGGSLKTDCLYFAFERERPFTNMCVWVMHVSSWCAFFNLESYERGLTFEGY